MNLHAHVKIEFYRLIKYYDTQQISGIEISTL